MSNRAGRSKPSPQETTSTASRVYRPRWMPDSPRGSRNDMPDLSTCRRFLRSCCTTCRGFLARQMGRTAAPRLRWSWWTAFRWINGWSFVSRWPPGSPTCGLPRAGGLRLDSFDHIRIAPGCLCRQASHFLSRTASRRPTRSRRFGRSSGLTRASCQTRSCMQGDWATAVWRALPKPFLIPRQGLLG